MKIFFLTLVAMVAMSCYFPFETVTGNGNLKKENREASGYTGISLSGSMCVQVAYSSTPGIVVEADENLLPYIETRVENGTLVIRTKDKVSLKSRHKMVVYTNMTKVTALKLSGSGNIKGSGDFTNDGSTDISVSGSGDIDMAIDHFSHSRIAISGSGNVKLAGKSSEKLDLAISGSGNIDCSDINSDEVDAKVSGSGDIRVFANKRIDAKVMGSGNIYYKGDAKDVNLKSMGSGKVIKV